MRAATTAIITLILLFVRPLAAQTVTDGSAAAIDTGAAKAVFALVGKGMKDPSTARYSRLRPGRSGAVCGEVDATNRMGTHTGPRAFVADPTSDVGGILPDAPELRHPSSMAQYQAMQRTLDLFKANCAAE